VKLYLLDEVGNTIAECEDQRKLGFYSPYDGCRLHIVDLDPNSVSAALFFVSCGVKQVIAFPMLDIKLAAHSHWIVGQASAGGWLEDTSLVKKYEISEEAYDARENTYRRFKEKKLQDDPNWTLKGEMEKKAGKAAVLLLLSPVCMFSKCAVLERERGRVTGVDLGPVRVENVRSTLSGDACDPLLH